MKHHYWLYGKRLLCLFFFYSVCRILFALFNAQVFSSKSWANLAYSFVFGLKFDASAIAVINLLYALFALVPHGFTLSKSYQFFLKWLFIAINLPLLLLNIADFEYFKFVDRRTNFEVFSISNDFLAQAPSLSIHFWYLIVIAFIINYLFIKFLPQTPPTPHSTNLHTPLSTVHRPLSTIHCPPSTVHRPLPTVHCPLSTVHRPLSTVHRPLFTIHYPLFIICLGLHILVFRGGFQEKPLRINQAFVLNDSALGNLSLNTPFTFLTTTDAIGTKKMNFYADEKLLSSLIRRDTIQHGFVHTQPQNVVIFILESFAAEYMAYGNGSNGYTPFLDSLATVGLGFGEAYANGRESIDAVPSVVAGIPKLMDEPYITSMYQSNGFSGLAQTLHKRGYETSFFHGARNGSMGFEGFSQIAGFQQYIGLNQYPSTLKDKDFDGTWGIFDEPFLQFFAQELSQKKQPFLSTLFTLSSHHPYTIPPQYKGKFPKGKAEVLESLGYADNALRLFFEKAKKEPWFENTLFILTADHTQQNIRPQYATELGAYRVPLILFHAKGQEMSQVKQKTNKQKVVQQADITASVLDYLGVAIQKPLPFGQSVFSTTEGLALQYKEGIFRLVKANYYVRMTEDGEAQTFDKTGKKIQNNGQAAAQLRAFAQFYRNGLIDNTWEK